MFLLFVLIYKGAVRNGTFSFLSRNLSLQYYPFHLHKCIFMQCKPLPKQGNRYGSGLNWNKHFSRGSEYFYSEKLGYVYPKNRAFLLAAFLTPNRESEKTGSPLTELYFFCHLNACLPYIYKYSWEILQYWCTGLQTAQCENDIILAKIPHVLGFKKAALEVYFESVNCAFGDKFDINPA